MEHDREALLLEVETLRYQLNQTKAELAKARDEIDRLSHDLRDLKDENYYLGDELDRALEKKHRLDKAVRDFLTVIDLHVLSFSNTVQKARQELEAALASDSDEENE